MAREWYCEVEGRLYGPLEPADLKHMAKRGDLRPTDKIRQGDAGKWVEARKAKGLFNRPSSRAEPMSAAPIAPEASVAIKDSATPDDDAIASWLGKPPSAPSPPPPSKSAAPPPADPAADWFPTGFDESDLLDKSPFSAHGTMVRGTSPDERKKP